MTAAPFVRRETVPFERQVLLAWSDGRILSIDAQLSLGLGSHDELLERATAAGVAGPVVARQGDCATVGIVGAMVWSGRSSRP